MSTADIHAVGTADTYDIDARGVAAREHALLVEVPAGRVHRDGHRRIHDGAEQWGDLHSRCGTYSVRTHEEQPSTRYEPPCTTGCEAAADGDADTRAPHLVHRQRRERRDLDGERGGVRQQTR